MRIFKREPHGPVIAVNTKGGLGNQLFQFANAVNLAIEFGRSIKFLDSTYKDDMKRRYLLDYWGLKPNLIYTVTLDSLGSLVFQEHFSRCKCELRQLDEENFFFKKIDLSSYGTSCLKIDGYWQSERYFLDVKDGLKRFLNSRLTNHWPKLDSILMHVRLGDFVSEESTILEHGVLGSRYYEKAISLNVQSNCIRVVSDEPAKVSHYFGQEFVEKYEFEILGVKDEFDTFSDFKEYESIILANSTFSWWGAYLSSAQRIIAPRAVFSEVGLRKRNVCDFYPDSWILV